MRLLIWGIAGTVVPVLILAAFLLYPRDPQANHGPRGAKPELHLLTALPLMWGDEFALDQPKSPAIERLQREYQLKSIDLPSQLPENGLLLAAQPRALPAEELVALDAWVRRGGRLVLLADPMLEWTSKRPIGDRLRPPLQYADTGLLQHWGLRLDAPEQRGSRLVRHNAPERLGDKAVNLRVMTISPGSLAKQEGTCSINFEGLYAECAVGKGWVWVIADADWLNEQLVSSAGGDMDINLFALGTVMRAASSTR